MPPGEDWNRKYSRLQERSQHLWQQWHDAHPANEAVYREKYRACQREIRRLESELEMREQDRR